MLDQCGKLHFTKERLMACQLGIPLNDATLSKMPEKERAFWHDFLTVAMKLIKEQVEDGKEEPFKPTDELTAMYMTAVDTYNGSQYCQVQQIKIAFGFDLN